MAAKEDRDAAPAVRVTGASYAYGGGGDPVAVPDVLVAPGQRVACVGPSGAGKSTLLQLMAGILLPHGGQVEALGHNLGGLPAAQRRALRLRRMGLVFQDLELLQSVTVEDNVLLPFGLYPGDGDAAAGSQVGCSPRDRARDLLDSAGLTGKGRRKPSSLSRGEQQRVAVCRALLRAPSLLLADEPTANLDPQNRAMVLQLLGEHVDRCGATLVMVTHDHTVLGGFDQVVTCGAGDAVP